MKRSLIKTNRFDFAIVVYLYKELIVNRTEYIDAASYKQLKQKIEEILKLLFSIVKTSKE